MNVKIYFYIEDEIEKKFNINVTCFILKKKKHVHFCFTRPLVSYPYFHDIIGLIKDRWEERKCFFTDYKFIYPKIKSSDQV